MAIPSVDPGARQYVFDGKSVRTSNPLSVQLSVV